MKKKNKPRLPARRYGSVFLRSCQCLRNVSGHGYDCDASGWPVRGVLCSLNVRMEIFWLLFLASNLYIRTLITTRAHSKQRFSTSKDCTDFTKFLKKWEIDSKRDAHLVNQLQDLPIKQLRYIMFNFTPRPPSNHRPGYFAETLQTYIEEMPDKFKKPR